MKSKNLQADLVYSHLTLLLLHIPSAFEIFICFFKLSIFLCLFFCVFSYYLAREIFLINFLWLHWSSFHSKFMVTFTTLLHGILSFQRVVSISYMPNSIFQYVCISCKRFHLQLVLTQKLLMGQLIPYLFDPIES